MCYVALTANKDASFKHATKPACTCRLISTVKTNIILYAKHTRLQQATIIYSNDHVNVDVKIDSYVVGCIVPCSIGTASGSIVGLLVLTIVHLTFCHCLSPTPNRCCNRFLVSLNDSSYSLHALLNTYMDPNDACMCIPF